MSAKFNTRNPAVKRIMQEIKELQQAQSAELIAEALEDDIFEWHFVIRGPPDSEFEGGIYHGRILLPAEYPFKPPAFMMLTPSGRFQTGVKICLSISSHHPEHWQPSWSVRTALTALVAFMPSPGQGALGSLDFTKEERRVLAAKSRVEVAKFGSPARQAVIDSMHQRMLELEKQAAAAAAAGGSQQPKEPSAQQTAPLSRGDSGTDDTAAADVPEQAQKQAAAAPAAAPAAPAQPATPAQPAEARPAALAAAAPAARPAQRPAAAVQVRTSPGDLGLTALAAVLVVAIAAILLRKILNNAGMLTMQHS